MLQPPLAVGLFVCERTIVEASTGNVSLISLFSRLQVEGFPSLSQSIEIFAILTDGLGEMVLELSVVRLDTLEAIYTQSWKVSITNARQRVRIRHRIVDCVFPAAGVYEINLAANMDWVAKTNLVVYEVEE